MDEDLTRCSSCGNISLEINFHKDRKDGLRPQYID